MSPREALSHQRDSSKGYTPGPLGDHPATIETKDGFLPITPEGYQINRDGIPAAYSAVALISSQLALLPMRVVKKVTDDDVLEPEPGHPVQALLDFPSRIVDPAQCWTMIFRDFISRGNGYAWIRRDFRYKRPIEIVPAHVVRSEFRQSRSAPYQRYTLDLLGGSVWASGTRHQDSSAADALTFHGPGFNGLYSPSPIAYAAASVVETMRATMEHHRNMLRKGLSGNSVIVVDKDAKIGFDVWQRSVDTLRTQYAGSVNAGKTPALPPGLRIDKMESFSASDLQLIELLKWGIEDIARVFEVSPIRLGHYHQGMRVRTFEAQAVDFERFSIMSRAHKLSEQMTMKLLTAEDRQENLRIHLDTSKVSLGTLSERIEAAGKAVSNFAIWTPNEGRRLTGQRRKAGGDNLLDPKGAPAQTKKPEGAVDDP